MPRSSGPRIAAALAVVACLAAAGWWLHGRSTPAPAPVPPPFQVSVPAWDRILTGDTARTTETYRTLSQTHPGLTEAEAGAAGRVAAAVLAADLTSQGREQWPGYWPPTPTTTTPPPVRCTQVRVLTASPVLFPVVGGPNRRVDWAKVLLPYAGTCGHLTYTVADPGVEYVYLTRVDDGAWQPVRDWAIPQTDPVSDTGAGTVPDWQLAPVGPCGLADSTTYRLRTLAADAFAQMCQAAAADKVVLVVSAGYRTRAEQARLFDDAVAYYGSVAKAKEWVAYADDHECDSRHCDGTAVNVEPDHAAIGWLNTIAGCAVTGTTPISYVAPVDGGCVDGQVPVRRSQMYGFVSPAPRIPGYLEFVLPTGTDDSPVPDCSPSGVGVDQMVASVFRCRLQRAGLAPTEVEAVVAQALVVSRCASGWNPTARVFAGRYAETPRPEDGRRYTEAGVFALREELVQAGWVDGDVLDPVANINGAASLWLATRGWEQFACATGTDPGLRAGPVLPAYGGPQIPAWATSY